MSTPKKQSGKTTAAKAQEQDHEPQEARMDGQAQASDKPQSAAQAEAPEDAAAATPVHAKPATGPGPEGPSLDAVSAPQGEAEAAEALALERVYAAMAELGLRPFHAKDWNLKDGRLVVVTTDGRKLSTDMPEA